MSTFVLSQILAGIAFMFGIAGFQFKRREVVLFFWFLCAITNGLHFFVLGEAAAGTLATITATRFLTASKYPKQWLSIPFALVTIIGFYIMYSNPLSYIVLVAGLIGCYGSFQKNDKVVRGVFMFCATLWLIHNILVGTPVGALMELCFIVSNIVGWFRVYKKTHDKVVT